MTAFATRIPWWDQPQEPAQIDWASGILPFSTTVEVLQPSVYLSYGCVKRKFYPVGSTTPFRAFGIGGVGTSIVGSNQNSYIELASSVDDILSLDRCTILLLRSLNSTTFTIGTHHGYCDSASVRLSMHAPYTDNKIYWDYADSTTGRISTSALSWTAGEVDALAFVAGPNKGREIWRNGVKVQSGAGTTVRAASTAPFQIGAAGAAGGIASKADNSETIYQFVLVNEELTDAQIIEWSRNPNAIFLPRSKIAWAVSTPTAGARPQIFVMS